MFSQKKMIRLFLKKKTLSFISIIIEANLSIKRLRKKGRRTLLQVWMVRPCQLAQQTTDHCRSDLLIPILIAVAVVAATGAGYYSTHFYYYFFATAIAVPQLQGLLQGAIAMYPCIASSFICIIFGFFIVVSSHYVIVYYFFHFLLLIAAGSNQMVFKRFLLFILFLQFCITGSF